MRVAQVLRLVAVVIAIAAVIDPAFTRESAQGTPLTLAVLDEDALEHAERLQRQLGRRTGAAIRLVDTASSAAACPSDGACLIVSRGRVPHRLTAGAAVVGGLYVPPPDPAISAVVAPASVHRDASVPLRVSLKRPVSRVDVFDGEVLVGSVENGTSGDVTVPWLPLDTGARALRIVADGDAVDVGVVVQSAPVPLVMHEPEPTWLGTFVRRALEDDGRFTVRGHVRVAPPVAVTRGGAGPLTAATLEGTGVVVVTSPQALRANEVDLLESFVDRRGGSVVLLFDTRPSGPVLRLVPRIVAERREPEEQDAGPLRVSEWLTFAPGVGITALASLNDSPVIVARAFGRGRVIASGALDAWRFRDEERFDEFWRMLLWDAAELAGGPLRLETDRPLAAVGAPVPIRAELQSLAPLEAQLVAAGELTCGDAREPVRLWPGARRGVFEGQVRLAREGRCELAVTVNDVTARLPLAARRELAEAPADGARFASMIRAHGGRAVEVGAEGDLVSHVQAVLQPHPVSERWRPMRSMYWLLPFAACLAGEWWLRRHSGLS